MVTRLAIGDLFSPAQLRLQTLNSANTPFIFIVPRSIQFSGNVGTFHWHSRAKDVCTPWASCSPEGFCTSSAGNGNAPGGATPSLLGEGRFLTRYPDSDENKKWQGS